MSKKSLSVCLLPEADWPWQRISPAARRHEQWPQRARLWLKLRLVFDSSAVLLAVLLHQVDPHSTIWFNGIFFVLISELALAVSFGAKPDAYRIRGAEATPSAAVMVVKTRLDRRIARLTGRRTALGRARCAHLDASKRLDLATRNAEARPSDSSFRQVVEAVAEELAAIEASDPYQNYLEVMRTAARLRNLLETEVMPRWCLEQTMTPALHLTAGDIVSCRETVAQITADGRRAKVFSSLADERQRIKVAVACPGDLDENINIALKASHHA